MEVEGSKLWGRMISHSGLTRERRMCRSVIGAIQAPHTLRMDPDALALLVVQQYLLENGFDAGGRQPSILVQVLSWRKPGPLLNASVLRLTR